MNFLRSLASLNTKKQITQPVTIGLVLFLVGLLMFRIPRDIHCVVTSIPMRVVWVIVIITMLSNYGVVSGLLTALIMIVLLTDVHVEAMTDKKDDKDNTTNSKDPVHDALEKVKSKTADKNLPLPKTNDNVTDTNIETAVANANEQGTLSQMDKDRAIKLSSHVNSNDESIVDQMKKEKEIEKSQPDKEGFAPMGTMNFNTGSLMGSTF